MSDTTPKLILALDTAQEDCAAALLDARTGRVTERVERVGNKHAERLLTLVGEVLMDAGVSKKDVDLVAFGAGPGAFTGLRVACGVALYENGTSPKLLMSGDHGRADYDEVNVMRNAAVQAGLPVDDVFMDHAGFSTYESMYRARDVFGAKRIVVVSQDYHLYRALYVAERLGLDAYGVPADLRPYAGQEARELREVLARNKDFLTAIVQPPPTFLGDPISLSGSAAATEG